MKTLASKLLEILETRRRDYSTIVTARYVNPRGTLHNITSCHAGTDLNLIVSSTQPGTHSSGEMVLLGRVNGRRQREIIGRPPAGLSGASEFPPSDDSLVLEAAKILYASPPEVYSGVSLQQIYLVGYGFSDGDTVSAKVMSSSGILTDDPYVTCYAASIVSDPGSVGLDTEPTQTILGLLIDVSGDAPLGYQIGYMVS